MFFDAYPHVDGGAQHLVARLAAGLPSRGRATRVVVPATGVFTERLVREGVTVDVVPPPAPLQRYGRSTRGWALVRAVAALPRYWIRLARELRRDGAVVHVDDHRGLVLAGPAARLARLPLVWHVHTVERSVLNRAGSWLASAVVIPSAAVLRAMPGLAARRPPVEIPPGVPADRRRAAGREGAMVVTVARLHPDKGVDVLVEAAALLQVDVPALRVLVIGGAQEGLERHETDLRTAIERLGLRGTVDLAGHCDDPSTRWRGARTYVQPSRTEVLPLALIEAMNAGFPIVATTVGGVPALIEDGVTGLLVPPEDPAALAAALRRLLEDGELAAALGDAAAARASERFSVDAMLDRFASLYATVTSR